MDARSYGRRACTCLCDDGFLPYRHGRPAVCHRDTRPVAARDADTRNVSVAAAAWTCEAYWMASSPVRKVQIVKPHLLRALSAHIFRTYIRRHLLFLTQDL